MLISKKKVFTSVYQRFFRLSPLHASDSIFSILPQIYYVGSFLSVGLKNVISKKRSSHLIERPSALFYTRVQVIFKKNKKSHYIKLN